MLSASLVTLTLAFTAAALPPKGQGLAQVYSSCQVPNHIALTFVSNPEVLQTNYSFIHFLQDDGPYKYLYVSVHLAKRHVANTFSTRRKDISDILTNADAKGTFFFSQFCFVLPPNRS